MNRTRRIPSRFTGTLTTALCVVFLVLVCAGPAGATATYAPTISVVSPQAGYNNSVLNVTNLAGTYNTNASRVTLIPAVSTVTLTSRGSLVDGPPALLDGAGSVYVNGSYAYVASNVSGALEIVNIANPDAPVHAGSIASGGGALLDGASDVFVYGKYAYVTSPDSNALEIVDISNPASPAHVNAIVNGAGGYATLDTPSAVFVANDSESTEVMAYVVSTGSNALQIIGVTNPASPSRRGTISNTAGAVGNMTTPRDIFVRGNYAYIAVANGLEIVDITGTWDPIEHVGFIRNGAGGAVLNNAYSVQVVGNYAYVASLGSRALEIVNVANPANPTHAGRLLNGTGGAWLDSPVSVSVWGTYAYVLNRNTSYIEVVDVSNPALPRHKASLKLGDDYGAAGIFVSGNTVYIASSRNKSLDIVASSSGSITGTGVRVLNLYRENTRLICRLPLAAKPAGSYHVVVTNPGLQQVVLQNGFTVYRPPVIPRESYPAWKGRGVLNNTGMYNDGGSHPNGRLLWNSTGVDFVSSTPVVSNGLVYAGDNSRYFYAIHISNGSVRWSKLLDDVVYSAPAVSDGRVFVGTGNSATTARTFYAFNATTGAQLWTNTSSRGGYSASPAVYNGMVIAGRDDGNVSAWNAANGREVWRFKTTGRVFSPAVANGKVVVSTGDWNLFSLDAATGRKFWDGRNSSSGWDGSIVLQSSPAVAYGKVYIGTSQHIRAYDELTGALLYEYEIAGAALEGSPAVANGLVHIATTGGSPDLSGGNGIYTLFANNLTLKWVNHTPENTVMEASPAVANGIVYITSNRANQNTKGFLYAWNAATGAPLWNFHLPGGGTDSSPAVIDGVVYLGQWWQGFLAIGTQHPVTLTSPNGGENWTRGTQKTIRWVFNSTPMPCTNVKLDLMRGAVVNRAIVASTPVGTRNSGTYTWNILAAQAPGTNYRVRITCGVRTDLSNDYFTISA